MSLMERSIQTVIDTFHKYSEENEHHDRLCQKEFRKMVKTELPNFLKKEKRNNKLIDDIMQDLDTNQDKELSFEEFSVLIAKLVFATHEKMHEHNPRGDNHSHGPGCGQK